MASVTVFEGGERLIVPLNKKLNRVGRERGCVIILENPGCSRKHCEIEKRDNGFHVRDLGSRNGLEVNGQRVTECRLHDGDSIRIGTARLVFQLDEGELDSDRLAATTPSGPVIRKPLGQMCVDTGLIRKEDLDECLAEQVSRGGRIGEIMVARGYLPEKKFLEVLGEQLNVPWIGLRTYEMDPKAVAKMDRSRAMEWQAVPVYLHESAKKLIVATCDPENLENLQAMEFLTGCAIEVLLASNPDIRRAIDHYYPKEDQIVASMAKAAKSADTSGAQVLEDVDGELTISTAEGENEKAVTQLVNIILEDAVQCGASDIHIEPRRESVIVRFRVDGLLQKAKAIPRILASSMVNRLKVLGHMNIAERRFPQDGRFLVRVGPREVDLRCSSLPTSKGEKFVLRLLDRSTAMVRIEDVGMGEDIRASLLQLIRRPEGVLIVTGPTGSGKTSTLYAALRETASEEKNLITLENPVEYEMDGINQAQVYDNPRFSFASGLRAILRQDPDVILVGETRDNETAQVVVQASLTGHLVLTTLHTNSAAATIPRLMDMGVEPYLLSASLIGILAQRLVRRICPDCRADAKISEEVLRGVFGDDPIPESARFYRGTGCEKCRNGYRGRTGVFELLEISEMIREKIVPGCTAQGIQRLARSEGMRTLREDAIRHGLEGMTTLEEVLRVTHSM